MSSGPLSEKQALAAEAWRLLFDVFISTRSQRDQVLERFELTPNDSKALWTLDPMEGKPMRALAEAWGTDASNVTWVVDRLERRGLAERRPLAGDRRVKLVALTVRGLKTREQILRAFHEPPPELLELARDDLRALREILGKLATTGRAHHLPALGGSPTPTPRTDLGRSGRATRPRRRTDAG